jgi:asparagine synthase (glutamine-hydrolysing)
MDGHGGDYTLNPRAFFPAARLLAMGRFKAFLTEFVAQARADRTPLWRSAWSNVLSAFLPRAPRRLLTALRAREPLFGPRSPVNPAFAKRMRPPGWPGTSLQASPALIDQSANLARALRRMQNQSNLAGTLGAAYGLEFTQPFHDKRVVELALAIPEDLYFRDGRARYLARTVLADILPTEFQTRSWRNIPRIPDLLDMARAQEPRMLVEIDRLQANPRVAAYFDFARMRRMVRQRPRDRRDPWAAGRVGRAMRAMLWALHVEWFMQDNAGLAGSDLGRLSANGRGKDAVGDI